MTRNRKIKVKVETARRTGKPTDTKVDFSDYEGMKLTYDFVLEPKEAEDIYTKLYVLEALEKFIVDDLTKEKGWRSAIMTFQFNGDTFRIESSKNFTTCFSLLKKDTDEYIILND